MENYAATSKSASQDQRIILLLCGVWCFYTVLLALNDLTNTFIRNTWLDSALLYGVFAFLILRAIPSICKRVNKQCILFALIYILLFLLGVLFNGQYMTREYYMSLISAFPALLLGNVIRFSPECKRSLYYASLVALAATFIHLTLQLYSKSAYIHDMTTSYAFLPSCCYLIYYSIVNKRKLSWIIAVLSVCAMIALSTRGSIVLCLMFLVFVSIRNFKKHSGRIVFFLLIILLIYISSNRFLNDINHIYQLLASKGITNGIIRRLMQGSFFESGRDSIWVTCFEYAGQRPIFGWGMFSSLKFVSTYSHNFLVELVLNFGFLGSLICVSFLLWRICKFIYAHRQDSSYLYFLSVVLVSSIGKLMFSSTYTQDPMFFLLIGILLIYRRSKEINTSAQYNGPDLIEE